MMTRFLMRSRCQRGAVGARRASLLALLAGCESMQRSTARRSTTSRRRRAGARDAARPHDADVRRSLHGRRRRRASPPRRRTAAARPRERRCRRNAGRAHRARRQRSAGSSCRATPEQAWNTIARSSGTENGFVHRGRAARARHHGNRLGGKPRRDAAGCPAAVRSASTSTRSLDVQARQVPHADRARQRARHRRDLHLPPRHGAGSDGKIDNVSPARLHLGSRCRRTRSSRRRCCRG